MINALVIFGTRPEAIKLAPLVTELKRRSSDFKTVVCVTGQHREMLDQVLDLFQIVPDHDIHAMSPNQDLFELTSRVLIGLRNILTRGTFDLILVQGDTTTAFVASLAALYCKIPVGHVEAGLRTYNKFHPYPEEKNRQLVSVLADYHFAPTRWAEQNLLREGIAQDRVWVTGNTGIDALLSTTKKLVDPLGERYWSRFFLEQWKLDVSGYGNTKRLILVTGHRRENFGPGFERICYALKAIAAKNKDIDVVYPVHLNPNVRKPVFELLCSVTGNGLENIHLLEPLDYLPFVYLMTKAHLILTDSGGIQEEAPSLGKPVLVMRDTTERPEGLDAGIVRLVGTSEEKIVKEAQILLDNPDHYREMSRKANPYGDGHAASRIVDVLRDAATQSTLQHAHTMVL